MLYQLNETRSYTKVKKVSLAQIGWKEKDLERLLSNNILDLISSNDLMTIFTERPRQEEPDILAIDSKGDLYIIELKRWASNQENLLQVLRYGQLYGKSLYDELNELYEKHTNKFESLMEVHSKYFDLSNDSRLQNTDFNKQQHFLVVVNGLDQKTVEAISYWKSNGLNIDGIVYWVFEIENKYFIEFNMYSPIESQLEYSSNCYVVNTNYTKNETCQQEMLTDEKVAAYWPGWREKIEKIQKDDTVFLYQSGIGIIAYGIASGKLDKKNFENHVNYEYSMKLNKFKKLKKPLAASEMKKIANQGFSFRNTMFSVSEESKDLLLNEVTKKYL